MSAQPLIPITAVRLAYLWPCNLTMAALMLSKTYEAPMTATQLEVLWDAECVNHPLLHELGGRPALGFDQARQDVALARSILGADHDKNGGPRARLSMEVRAEKVA